MILLHTLLMTIGQSKILFEQQKELNNQEKKIDYNWNSTKAALIAASIEGQNSATLLIQTNNKNISKQGYQIIIHVPQNQQLKIQKIKIKCISKCKYRLIITQPQIQEIKISTPLRSVIQSYDISLFRFNLTDFKQSLEDKYEKYGIDITVQYQLDKGLVPEILKVIGSFNSFEIKQYQLNPYPINQLSLQFHITKQKLDQYQWFYLFITGQQVQFTIKAYNFTQSKNLKKIQVKQNEIHPLFLQQNFTANFLYKQKQDVIVCFKLWFGSFSLNTIKDKKKITLYYHDNLQQSSCYIFKNEKSIEFNITGKRKRGTSLNIEYQTIQSNIINITSNRLYQSLGQEYKYRFTVNVNKYSTKQQLSLRVYNRSQNNIGYSLCNINTDNCKYRTKDPFAKLQQYKQYHLQAGVDKTQQFIFDFNDSTHYQFQIFQQGHLHSVSENNQYFFIGQSKSMLFLYKNQQVQQIIFHITTLNGNLSLYGTDDYKNLFNNQKLIHKDQIKVKSKFGRFYLKAKGQNSSCSFILRARPQMQISLYGQSEQIFIMSKDIEKKIIKLKVKQEKSQLIVDCLSGQVKSTLYGENYVRRFQNFVKIQKKGKYQLKLQKQKGVQAQIAVLLSHQLIQSSCKTGKVNQVMTLPFNQFVSCFTYFLHKDVQYLVSASSKSAGTYPLFIQVYVSQQLVQQAKSILKLNISEYKHCNQSDVCEVKIQLNSFSRSAQLLIYEQKEQIELLKRVPYTLNIIKQKTFKVSNGDNESYVNIKLIESQTEYIQAYISQQYTYLTVGQNHVDILPQNKLKIVCKNCTVKIQITGNVLPIPINNIPLTANKSVIFQFIKQQSDQNYYEISSYTQNSDLLQCFSNQQIMYKLQVDFKGKYLIRCKSKENIHIDMNLRVLGSTKDKYSQYWLIPQQYFYYYLMPKEHIYYAFYWVDNKDPFTIFQFRDHKDQIQFSAFILKSNTNISYAIDHLSQNQLILFQNSQLSSMQLNIEIGNILGIRIKRKNESKQDIGTLLIHNQKHSMLLPTITVQRKINTSQAHYYYLYSYQSILLLKDINKDINVQIKYKRNQSTTFVNQKVIGKHWFDLNPKNSSGQSVYIKITALQNFTQYSISRIFSKQIIYQNVYQLEYRQPACIKFHQDKQRIIYIQSNNGQKLYISIKQDQKQLKKSAIESMIYAEQIGLYTITTKNITNHMICCVQLINNKTTQVTIIFQQEKVHTLINNFSILYQITPQQKYFQTVNFFYDKYIIVWGQFCYQNTSQITLYQSQRQNNKKIQVDISYNGFNVLLNQTYINYYFKMKSSLKQSYLLLNSASINKQFINPVSLFDFLDYSIQINKDKLNITINQIRFPQNSGITKCQFKLILTDNQISGKAYSRCKIGRPLYQKTFTVNPTLSGISQLVQTISLQQIPKYKYSYLNFEYWVDNVKFTKQLDLLEIQQIPQKSNWFLTTLALILLVVVIVLLFRTIKKRRAESLISRSNLGGMEMSSQY